MGRDVMHSVYSDMFEERALVELFEEFEGEGGFPGGGRGGRG